MKCTQSDERRSGRTSGNANAMPLPGGVTENHVTCAVKKNISGYVQNLSLSAAISPKTMGC